MLFQSQAEEMMIEEPVFPDGEGFPMPDGGEMPSEGGVNKIWIFAGVGTGIIIAGAVTLVVLKKRKAKKEEMMLDEEE